MNEHRTSRRLTDTHEQVLFFLSKGLRNAEIAHQLGLTERTIKGYVTQLLLIFDVTNRTELIGLFTCDSIEGRKTIGHLKSPIPKAT
jgi:DNA-binding NarL/FixJ family response regulator